METKQIYDLRKIIDKSNWWYVNDSLTTEHFPIPEKVETENWKLITMSKSFSSQEAIDEIKRQGCRPANAYELALWANTHREKEMLKGERSVVIAFGQTYSVLGDHRVPSVSRGSGGDFSFSLDYWGGGWDDYCVLLAFCDPALGTLDTSIKTSATLTLAQAIEICKENNLTVTKVY